MLAGLPAFAVDMLLAGVLLRDGDLLVGKEREASIDTIPYTSRVTL